MGQLSIGVDRRAGFVLVRLGGEIDRNTWASLARTFTQLLSAERPRIVVDAAELRFCDSSGLWELISAQRRAEAAGGSLRLIGVHGVLARLLTITRLVDRFPPYSGLEEASRWPEGR
ncbi:hypothetical protein GCM10010149_03520 [Nonomuraea roseoviolacea subsp. roseoviolacea]|uniref:STAS domain-containing protein n=1 Tax=Nonomuraea roseoviolacea TaxID=103837 RepID=UPI0031DF9339